MESTGDLQGARTGRGVNPAKYAQRTIHTGHKRRACPGKGIQSLSLNGCDQRIQPLNLLGPVWIDLICRAIRAAQINLHASHNQTVMRTNKSESLRKLLNLEFEDAPPVVIKPRQINPGELATRANVFGVTLNGEPAKLVIGRLAKIVSASNSALFNWTAAEYVILRKGGKFIV